MSLSSTHPIAAACLALAALPAAGQETRDLDAHEHGHGALNIAVEGNSLAMELEAPGFDIVGFEHAAETDADTAAVESALATLAEPAGLFGLPDAAACEVTEVSVDLHGEDAHDDHDHDKEHAEHAEEHDHDEGEAHENHAEEEGHDDHEHEAEHSEFHAEYHFTCENIAALDSLTLTYFDLFENAEELEVQFVSDKGALLMEATPEAPVLDLSDAM